MEVKIGEARLELVEGDITRQDVDAIVNAANTTLLGGGGVDGAIHRAAGPELLEECRTLGGCKTGDAKLTRGYRLPAKFVIHGVGPVYRDGKHGEPELLASVYCRALEIATEQHLKSISFPAISTGAFGYPLREAAHIALQTPLQYLQEHDEPALVRFVLYDAYTYEIHEQVMQELLAA